MVKVKKNEKIAKKARSACEAWRNYFQTNIDHYHKNFEFILGRQWTDEESDVLQGLKKVPLTFNKLSTLINALLGEQQQNTPQLEVVPMENCDEQTAQVRELIIKDIMFDSRTKLVYQMAAKQSAIGGFGAFALLTDYTHDKSFELDIKYKYFKDATTCYWDAGAELDDKTDGMHCGYTSLMSRKKFRAKYGKRAEAQINKDDGVGATKEDVSRETATNSNGTGFEWSDKDSITINDFFVRKFESDTLYKMSNGKIYNHDEIVQLFETSKQLANQMMGVVDEYAVEGEDEQASDLSSEEVEEQSELITLFDEGQPVRIEDKRDIKKSVIHHYKIAGDYVLEESVFPSENMPIIFVDQNSYFDKNGKQITRGFLDDARDAQRYINYLGTQSAYTLKVSRYDQWLGSKKNVASNDTQAIWKDPLNTQGLLTYDESPSGARPEQVRPPELSQSLLTQYERAINDLYTSTGLYATRMGQQGNEQSGAAIDARTRQGSYPTYVYFNNINRAITSGGRILNEMIPNVYDSERVFSLMTGEGLQNVSVNKQVDEYGEIIENDLSKGTYQVNLKPGASYEGQKEQALQSLNMVLQANPQLLNLFADLYADNLPLSNTIEIKNRLKTIVPPEIIEAGKTGKTPPPKEQKPDPQEQAAMMAQQAKMKELELKEQELQLKAEKQQVETTRELEKLKTERLQIASGLQEQEMRYAAETHRTNTDEQIAHADNLMKILTSKVE